MTSEWYCQIGNRIDGTLTGEELLRLAADGVLGPSEKVRRGKEGAWIEARQLPGLTFPDDFEQRSQAVSASRPEPIVGEPQRAASDEFEVESIGDILAHPFDTRKVRGERLLALSGGEWPIEQFPTCKVARKKKPGGWLVRAGPSEVDDGL